MAVKSDDRIAALHLPDHADLSVGPPRKAYILIDPAYPGSSDCTIFYRVGNMAETLRTYRLITEDTDEIISVANRLSRDWDTEGFVVDRLGYGDVVYLEMQSLGLKMGG